MEETKELLLKGHHGTLAVNGDDGFPYAVPVNYVYVDDAIYIHSAQYGYKIEALKKDNKVCFSAIIHSEILPSKFTAEFESVVGNGTVDFIEEENVKQHILEVFIDRFSPDYKEGGLKFIKAMLEKTAILKVNLIEVKGKAYRGQSWK